METAAVFANRGISPVTDTTDTEMRNIPMTRVTLLLLTVAFRWNLKKYVARGKCRGFFTRLDDSQFV